MEEGRRVASPVDPYFNTFSCVFPPSNENKDSSHFLVISGLRGQLFSLSLVSRLCFAKCLALLCSKLRSFNAFAKCFHKRSIYRGVAHQILLYVVESGSSTSS